MKTGLHFVRVGHSIHSLLKLQLHRSKQRKILLIINNLSKPKFLRLNRTLLQANLLQGKICSKLSARVNPMKKLLRKAKFPLISSKKFLLCLKLIFKNSVLFSNSLLPVALNHHKPNQFFLKPKTLNMYKRSNKLKWMTSALILCNNCFKL